jgi:hypothetical protein
MIWFAKYEVLVDGASTGKEKRKLRRLIELVEVALNFSIE